MIEQDNAVIINESFALLPGLLVKWGVVLKQKYGYKAGKISRTRNWCQPIGYIVAVLFVICILLLTKFFSSPTIQAYLKMFGFVRSFCNRKKSPHGGLVVITQAERVGLDLGTGDGALISRSQYLQMLEQALEECTMYFAISRVSSRALLDKEYITIDGTHISRKQIQECKQNREVVVDGHKKVTLDEINRAKLKRANIVDHWNSYFKMQIEHAKAIGPAFKLWRVFVIPHNEFEDQRQQVQSENGVLVNYWEKIVKQHYDNRELGFKIAYYPEEQAKLECRKALNQISVFGNGRDRWCIEVISENHKVPEDLNEPIHEVLNPVVQVRVEFAETVQHQLSSQLFQRLKTLHPWEYTGKETREQNTIWNMNPIFKKSKFF